MMVKEVLLATRGVESFSSATQWAVSIADLQSGGCSCLVARALQMGHVPFCRSIPPFTSDVSRLPQLAAFCTPAWHDVTHATSALTPRCQRKQDMQLGHAGIGMYFSKQPRGGYVSPEQARFSLEQVAMG
jgi:hypothetical protein